MTYSMVARDPATGDLGVAVQSHWFSVGSVVPHVRPGVGAVALQSVPDVTQGPRILDRLGDGASPDEALDAVLRLDEAAAIRQTAVVDASGRVTVHTGPACIAERGHVEGDGWTAQANMMRSPGVPEAMASAFTAASGPLAERLVTALEAAEEAGGDIRGRQSAALVAGGVELRVEDHDDPVGELRRLLVLHRAYAALSEADDLVAVGRFDAAAERAEHALTLAPENAEFLFWAGLGTAQTGDVARGAGLVRRAIEIHAPWRELLDRLGPEHAPAAEAVRAAL